jgi:hypothetical protein
MGRGPCEDGSARRWHGIALVDPLVGGVYAARPATCQRLLDHPIPDTRKSRGEEARVHDCV